MGFDFIDYGINYIKAEALNGDSELDMQSFSYINDVAHNKLKRSILQNNDVLVTIAGVNIGKVGIVKQKHLPANTNQAVGIVRIKSELANSSYIYYWFKNPLTFNHLQNINAQAAQPNINLEMLGNLSLLLPDIQNQQRIASAITAYDELININRRRIQLLEEAARLLFREWFVYFKFPNHEKVNVIDGVPEGWNKEKINKLVTFKRGVEPGSDNYLETYESGSFPFFRVSDLVARNPSIFVDEQYAKSALLKKSDIVISLDGSVGIVSMGLEGCYSTGIRKLIIKDKKINRAYLYFLMKSHYVQGVINAYAKGTTIQHAGEAIKHMNPILPPQNLMDLFDEIASPALNEILILLEQNQKLAQARDLLLPRLMSGAIEV
jgi:type I restriction enzyme S subunit